LRKNQKIAAFMEKVNLTIISFEKDSRQHHFTKNTPHAPNVHGFLVVLGRKNYFRGTVVASSDVLCVD
jgi:hypothetical protein